MENEPQDAYLPDSEGNLQPFDVREQSGGGGMVKLVGVAISLLILAFVVMKLFESGTRDRGQTPRILADNTPYKKVPLDRGGAQTPNQDKEIYQVLNGTTPDIAVKTMPVSEEPLAKPLPKPMANTKPAANVVIKEPETTQSAKPKINPVRVPAVPKPKQISGNYVVQVASLRSKAEAEAMWVKLSGKTGSLLTAKHFADIKRVDLGVRGMYYRLRVSGLADKNAANQLCQKLKAAKQDCIITPK